MCASNHFNTKGVDIKLLRPCGPEVIFKTCVAMKFVDDDDDDDHDIAKIKRRRFFCLTVYIK